MPDQFVAAAREGFLNGFNDILVVGSAIAFAGAVLVLVLVRSNHIRSEAAVAGDEAFEPVPEPVAA